MVSEAKVGTPASSQAEVDAKLYLPTSSIATIAFIKTSIELVFL